ncbi:sulfurtransferase TusA family protein [Thermosulfurimonas sp. F29]|uniref:sulfurtransferase TusA family protein n=1 Tax=Thermosulfurimonas sp. F29 TaxID=2867247 RepID=UPI001C8338F9|nr:sulfurtransferase TusA family protein [Thermosulfurimonas sp. F29]MBX6422611.1 sulfurtransferase TusA family protein [Thermosulfurimonas sp. F29]
MRFVEDIKADLSVDLVYRMCPMHLLEPEEFLRKLRVGQILEILTDYDGALEDIPAWCARRGQEFLGVKEDDGFFRLYIKKIREV